MYKFRSIKAFMGPLILIRLLEVSSIVLDVTVDKNRRIKIYLKGSCINSLYFISIFLNKRKILFFIQNNI